MQASGTARMGSNPRRQKRQFDEFMNCPSVTIRPGFSNGARADMEQSSWTSYFTLSARYTTTLHQDRQNRQYRRLRLSPLAFRSPSSCTMPSTPLLRSLRLECQVKVSAPPYLPQDDSETSGQLRTPGGLGIGSQLGCGGAEGIGRLQRMADMHAAVAVAADAQLRWRRVAKSKVELEARNQIRGERRDARENRLVARESRSCRCAIHENACLTIAAAVVV